MHSSSMLYLGANSHDDIRIAAAAAEEENNHHGSASSRILLLIYPMILSSLCSCCGSEWGISSREGRVHA